MKKRAIVCVAGSVLLAAALLVVVAARAVFLRWNGFAHDEHLVGPYRLVAVDVDEQMTVCRDVGRGGGGGGDGAEGVIGETVFAVGWDGRYLVAKQHPRNDRQVTKFFYIELARDGQPKGAVVVTGPLSEGEFTAEKAELGLPEFTRVIESVK